MPKERLHLLLADHTLRKLEALSGAFPTRAHWKTAFFHGAMAPDLLFYDPPVFKFSSVGKQLHRLMASSRPGSIPKRLGDILSTRGGSCDPNPPWLLGVAHHFMVDLLWHPLINSYVELHGTPCHTLELNNRDCHHWLESELESFWLGRMGPPGGYISFLKQLQRDVTWRMTMAGVYRDFLKTLGLFPVPSVTEISRCSRRQIQLMIEFARPRWAKIKGSLLKASPTKYIGALIVPQAPCPQARISKGPAGHHRLWESDFVSETVNSIATEFLSLPGWSRLSPRSQCPPIDRDRPDCPTDRSS